MEALRMFWMSVIGFNGVGFASYEGAVDLIANVE
jgi:hypothetical protein